MRCFYVDYENVKNKGLNGISELENNDQVFILYSENANTMTMDTVKKITKSKAKIDYIDIKCLGPNALDFQLCVLMGAKIGKFRGTNLELYIVSEDHGYDSVQNGVTQLLSKELKKRKIKLSIDRVKAISTVKNQEIEKIKQQKILEEKREKSREKRTKFSSLISAKMNNSSKYSSNLDEVLDILTELPSLVSCEFHNQCVKKFGNSNGKEIYQLLKKEIPFVK